MKSLPSSLLHTHPHLSALLEKVALLPVEASRSGAPTVRFGEKLVHSRVDPRGEARRFVEHWLEHEGIYLPQRLAEGERVRVVFLGIGLGYLLLEFCALLHERGLDPEKLELWVFENSPELLKTGLDVLDWSGVPNSLRLYVGTDGKTALEHDAEKINTPLICTSPNIAILSPAIYQELSQKILRRVKAATSLRILVPLPIYGGSVPAARYCAQALETLGHRVEILDCTRYDFAVKSLKNITHQEYHRDILQGLLNTFLAETIVARAIDWKADMVLALAQTPLMPESLLELRREGIATAMWFVEDYHLFTYWNKIAGFYDHFFAIQKGDFKQALAQVGQNHFHYLPVAACSHLHKPMTLTAEEQRNYGSDISFVGAGYFNRLESFQQLMNYDFKIWGNDWPKDSLVYARVQQDARRVEPAEIAKIFSASKINLNLHSSPTHPGVDPFGDFVNPRTFEASACGAFQLVDERKYLGELFDLKSEVATFRTTSELQSRIDYFLTHSDERADIARRGRERVLREHTYEHRMNELIDVVQNARPNLGKRMTNHPSELIRRAGAETKLGKFFRQFQKVDEELTIDRITDHIRKGKGELTDVEGTFLLMKEFRDWAVEKGVID